MRRCWVLVTRASALCLRPFERRTLRRRSQKDVVTWEWRLANDWLPKPRILHPWPHQRRQLPEAGVVCANRARRICAGRARQWECHRDLYYVAIEPLRTCPAGRQPGRELAAMPRFNCLPWLLLSLRCVKYEVSVVSGHCALFGTFIGIGDHPGAGHIAPRDGRRHQAVGSLGRSENLQQKQGVP